MPRYRVNGTLAHGDPILVPHPEDPEFLVPKLDPRTHQPLSTSREYHDGDYFNHPDQALLDRLHKQGAISTEEEYAMAAYQAGNIRPLADMQAERDRAAALAEENARLKVELDALRARQGMADLIADALTEVEPVKSEADDTAN